MTPSIGVRDIIKGLRALGLTPDSAVIAHTSLSAFGQVRGGAPAVLAALRLTCGTVVMPAFTYQAMIWPLTGPEGNGMVYDRPEYTGINRQAAFFHPDLPVHEDIGLIPETLRRQTWAARSSHPVLSFVASGRHAAEALAGQTLEQPLAPIDWLRQNNGDVLLIGVGHTRNTSLHLAERLADRKQFTRWAIVREEESLVVRAARLPNFPGCSEGFDAIEPEVARATTQVTIGQASVRRVPLGMLIPIAVGWISEDPDALLCTRPDCQRCNDVRRANRPDGKI